MVPNDDCLVSHRTGAEDFRVKIAGGGVAALEAVLALRDLAGDRAEVELIAPDPEFTLRALSVAQPFDASEPHRLDVAEFCREHGVGFRADGLAEVWGEQQRLLTLSGEEVFYDALLIAFGARQRAVLPGATVFRGPTDVDAFSELLAGIERGAVRHVAFAVPREVRWSLPLYELALMTAHRARERAPAGVEVAFVTHERGPLDVFGERISGRIGDLLAEAGIALHASRSVTRFERDRLLFDDGRGLDTNHVITLPALGVPPIPGVAQGRNGFIGTDPRMRVDGLDAVWAAGDATWFPIKQGGIAAQQAEVAAAGIAAAAGADAEPEPFRPLIRGALLTGDEARFIRAAPGGAGGEFSTSPLWWPPAKVAGPRLAPYLSRLWGGVSTDPRTPMEDFGHEGRGQAAEEEEHRASLQLALTFADLDAREGEFEDALRWLDVAEHLNVTIPIEYASRRERWRRELVGADS